MNMIKENTGPRRKLALAVSLLGMGLAGSAHADYAGLIGPR